jgi:hypothetical protein
MEVQRRVADLLKDKILVGHAVFNDLKACPPIINSFFRYLTVLPCRHYCCRIHFPRHEIPNSLRTNTNFPKAGDPALRNLTAQEFGIQIQGGEHSSVRLIPRVPCYCMRITFACRLQTPGPRWRYTVSIVVSGKRGRDWRYHRPRSLGPHPKTEETETFER